MGVLRGALAGRAVVQSATLAGVKAAASIVLAISRTATTDAVRAGKSR
jgi:hypothetical protein